MSDFDDIVQKLTQASEDYYSGTVDSPMSDDEYDAELQYLKDQVNSGKAQATPEYLKLIKDVASGTDNQGTVKHDVPMLSLQKAKSEAELVDFLNRTVKYGADKMGWEVEAKLDGISLSVLYKNGKPTLLSTRGNGLYGDDVTALIRDPETGEFPNPEIHINGLPLLENNLSAEIRGECLMTNDDFKYTDEQRYQVLKAQNDSENVKVKKDDQDLHFKNPRNAAAGIINRCKSTNSSNVIGFKCQLSFFAYYDIPDDEHEDLFRDNNGLTGFISTIDQTEKILGEDNKCPTIQDVIEKVNKFGDIRKAGLIPFPTDGIVIKCQDDVRISEAMGATAHHPSSQLAYKYPAEQKETTVLEIQEMVGRTGRLAWRARFNPVQLDGSVVQYATLHNYEWLHERDVRVGSQIIVEKANDVIPYVVAVISTPPNSQPYPEPEVCPLCGTKLDKRTLLWRCPNEKCPSRGIKALETAVSKNYLDIDGLSSKTLDALNDVGAVNDLSDIFILTEDQIADAPTGEVYDTTVTVEHDAGDPVLNKDGSQKTDKTTGEPVFYKATVIPHKKGDPILIGKKTAHTIYESIQKAKHVGLARTLASLNIPTLGLEGSKNLAKHFQSIDNILNATQEELEQVDLISDIKSDLIYQQLQEKKPLIQKLRDEGVTFEYNLVKNSDVLNGQIVVISGDVPGYNREEARELVEQNGGKSSSAVSSHTTLLVADENSTHSKVKKAKQLGIKIIPATEFLKEIGKA